MSGGGVGATSVVRSGYLEQPASANGLVTGFVANLIRSMGFTIEAESALIEGKGIAQGARSGVEVDTNASSGTMPWESGTDEDSEVGAWPIMAALRRPSLTPPAAVAFSGSYLLEVGVVLSNGKTGARLVHVAGADFAVMYGVTSFPVRISGSTSSANNRYIVVERAFDDAGDSTLEFVVGYQSGPVPAGPVTVQYGTPLSPGTEVLTVQVGQRSPQGTIGDGMSRCFSFYQEYGFGTPRFHAAAFAVINDLEVAVAPGSNMEYTAGWTGGDSEANIQTNPGLPPAGDYDNGAVLVDGVVAEGAASLDMDAGLAAGTILVGDHFTVAGATGVYVFDAPQTATAGAITGATFTPAAPAGGFANDAAVTIVHGEGFTPTQVVPVSKATARGDGGPGGLAILGIVTKRTEEAVLLTCEGVGGLTGSTLNLVSNNSPNDGTTCRAPRNVTRGTLSPGITADMELAEDRDADRPRILTQMGRTATKQKCRVDLAWEFNLQEGETIPAAVFWHGPDGQSDAFNYVTGERDGTIAGTMTIEMGESTNAEGEVATAISHTLFPAI